MSPLEFVRARMRSTRVFTHKGCMRVQVRDAGCPSAPCARSSRCSPFLFSHYFSYISAVDSAALQPCARTHEQPRPHAMHEQHGGEESRGRGKPPATDGPVAFEAKARVLGPTKASGRRAKSRMPGAHNGADAAGPTGCVRQKGTPLIPHGRACNQRPRRNFATTSGVI